MDEQQPYLVPISPDLGKLDKQSAQELFRWQWEDKDGRTWIVEPKTADETKHLPAQTHTIRVEGDISVIENGRKHNAGVWSRTIDAVNKTIHHNQLEIFENHTTNIPLQGQGFAAAWMEHCAYIYRDIDIDEVYVDTSDDGAATWPKLGFNNSFRTEKLDWDSHDGQSMRSQLNYMLKHFPSEEIAPDFEQSQGNSDKFISFRLKIQELLQKEHAPKLNDLVRELDGDYLRSYLHGEAYLLMAKPDDILSAINERYKREIPEYGQESLDL